MRGVIITGAARRIGADMARALAADDWHVILHYMTSSDGACKLQNAIRAAGGKASVFAADLEQKDQCDALVDFAFDECDDLYGLINNASHFEYNDFLTANEDHLLYDFRVNTIAPITLAQRFHEKLPDDKKGCIINILDNKVFHPNPDYFSYTVSKSALYSVTTMLGYALPPRIRVAGIAPGITLVSGKQSEENFKQGRTMNPIGQGCTTEQVSLAAKFILSTESYNGQILTIDGGEFLSPHARDVAFLSPD